MNYYWVVQAGLELLGSNNHPPPPRSLNLPRRETTGTYYHAQLAWLAQHLWICQFLGPIISQRIASSRAGRETTAGLRKKGPMPPANKLLYTVGQVVKSGDHVQDPTEMDNQ